MKRLLSKILSYAVYIFLIVYIITSIFIPSKTTDIFGVRMMVVISDSMEPKINVYDLIVILKMSVKGIEENDIITFETYLPRVGRDDYVTHYVRDIQTESGQSIYKTQGLNIADDSYDQWEDEDGNPIDITYDDIEGIYMFKIPYIGRFVYLLRDPIFDLLLLTNAGIIYLLYTQIKKYKKKWNSYNPFGKVGVSFLFIYP